MEVAQVAHTTVAAEEELRTSADRLMASMIVWQWLEVVEERSLSLKRTAALAAILLVEVALLAIMGTIPPQEGQPVLEEQRHLLRTATLLDCLEVAGRAVITSAVVAEVVTGEAATLITQVAGVAPATLSTAHP